MGAMELIGDFIGWAIISFVMFIVFWIGSSLFHVSLGLQELLLLGGSFGLLFYGLYRQQEK